MNDAEQFVTISPTNWQLFIRKWMVNDNEISPRKGESWLIWDLNGFYINVEGDVNPAFARTVATYKIWVDGIDSQVAQVWDSLKSYASEIKTS